MITRAPTHGVQRYCDLNHQPAHAGDPSIDLDAVEFVNLFGQRLHAAIGL